MLAKVGRRPQFINHTLPVPSPSLGYQRYRVTPTLEGVHAKQLAPEHTAWQSSMNVSQAALALRQRAVQSTPAAETACCHCSRSATTTTTTRVWFMPRLYIQTSRESLQCCVRLKKDCGVVVCGCGYGTPKLVGD